MKKTFAAIAAFFAIAVFVSFFCFSAFAETYSGLCGDNVGWSFDPSTGVLTITGTGKPGTGEMFSYREEDIPWRSLKDTIREINADSVLQSVSRNAFAGCAALESVDLPAVYQVGDSAFSGCTSLKSVELSSDCLRSMPEIENRAFADCSSLTKIVIPFSRVKIGEEAFYGCENLKILGIYTDAVIGKNAFAGCPKLASIYMINNGAPFSGTISDSAFSGVKADVFCQYSYMSTAQYSKFGGQFTNKKMDSGLSGYRAFWNYDRTEEVLTVSGEGKLFEYSGGSQLPWMEYNNWYYCNAKKIIIENGITEIPSYAFEYMGAAESVSLPDTLLRLYPNAFNDCTALSEITIPSSVEYVDGSTYWNRCPNLKEVYYLGTEKEWNEIYHCTTESYRIVPHFLTPVLRGDVNGDGKLDNSDAVYLLRNIMIGDYYPIAQSGDMNGDGKSDNSDAVYLLRHIMLGDVYPLR